MSRAILLLFAKMWSKARCVGSSGFAGDVQKAGLAAQETARPFSSS